jgi:hypothetical protein
LQRFLAGVPNTRAAAFRQSATEVGVDRLITIATSTTTATFMAELCFNGLPEAAPAVLNGTPLLTGALFGSGRREFAAEVSRDLPSLAPGATALLDVTVNGARAGDLALASLVSSTRFIELDAAVWSNNTVRVMARNISAATFDLAAATLSVAVIKRRIP